MSPEQRVMELGLDLPPASQPKGSFVPTRRHAAAVYTTADVER